MHSHTLLALSLQFYSQFLNLFVQKHRKQKIYWMSLILSKHMDIIRCHKTENKTKSSLFRRAAWRPCFVAGGLQTTVNSETAVKAIDKQTLISDLPPQISHHFVRLKSHTSAPGAPLAKQQQQPPDWAELGMFTRFPGQRLARPRLAQARPPTGPSMVQSAFSFLGDWQDVQF